VLIRRKWITADDEKTLLPRLGLTLADGGVRILDSATTNGWQAFLIGLLFRQDKDRFAAAVSDALARAPLEALHQLLGSLRHHGKACPGMVSDALRVRVLRCCNRASTDTQLIDVLAAIAPSKLLKLCAGNDWADWLAEARKTLCEAIRGIAADHEVNRSDAIEALEKFMRDASFQVRRSAYRAIASCGGSRLESTCEGWSRSTDVELRKRAAEAAAWLPIIDYSDEAVSRFGFGWDPEPSVREIWGGVFSARRKRHWSDEYVALVLEAAAGDNRSIVNAYRYGRALSKVGDDESARRIEKFLGNTDLRPNVRHWLRRVASEIRKGWKKVTDKWPEPWSHEPGTVDHLDGALVLSTGTRVNAKLSLWCRFRSGPSDLGEWGGVAEATDRTMPFSVEEREVELQIPGRLIAHARVFGAHLSSSSTAKLVLSGTSAYPTELPQQRMETEKGAVDTVAEIVRDAGLNVTAEDPEVIRRLQLVLKRAEVSLFSMAPEFDPGLRLKRACQETALVTRAIAEILPTTFLSSVALWRIANSILERELFVLRLSPRELDTLGKIARLGDRDSPDDLLFWMIDRVERLQSDKMVPKAHAASNG
jgi:hypothetical protein